MKKELIAFAGGFVVGFGIGYGVSYILTKKKYEKIAEKEIEEAKEFYSGEWSNVIHKDPPATLLEKAQNGEIDADEIHIGIANNRGGLSEAKNTVDYTKYYAKKKEGEPYDPAEHEYPSEEDIEETMEDHFTEGKRMTEEAKEIGNYIIAVTPESCRR